MTPNEESQIQKLRKWAKDQRTDITVRTCRMLSGDLEVIVFDWTSHTKLAQGSSEYCVAMVGL